MKIKSFKTFITEAEENLSTYTRQAYDLFTIRTKPLVGPSDVTFTHVKLKRPLNWLPGNKPTNECFPAGTEFPRVKISADGSALLTISDKSVKMDSRLMKYKPYGMKMSQIFQNITESSNIPMSGRSNIVDMESFIRSNVYLERVWNKAKREMHGELPVAVITLENGKWELVFNQTPEERREIGVDAFKTFYITNGDTFVTAKINIQSSYITPLDDYKYANDGVVKWEHPWKYRYIAINKNDTLKFI